MGFNVQQKATIDNYRSAKKLGFVLSDEAVAKLIKKEMEELGTVYPGFESLAKSATKPQIKQPAQPMPSITCQSNISVDKFTNKKAANNNLFNILFI